MPAISFMRRFAPLVESGQKKQTIRKLSKRKIKPGDTLQLYCCQRSSKGYKIGEAVCIQVTHFYMTEFEGDYFALLDGAEMRGSELDQLAKDDGFKDRNEFFKFFKERFDVIKCSGGRWTEFNGELIVWDEVMNGEREGARLCAPTNGEVE